MNSKKRIFALGFFDGVHLGHQALLRRCVEMSRELHCEAAAITFDRHPKSLVLPDPPVLISTSADRHRILKDYGISYVREFPVIPEVTGMYWRDFLQILLDEGAAGFVCGDDFRFGWKGEGNARNLQLLCEELGLPCVIIPEQLLDGIRISSTYIRRQIEQGHMDTAINFLGHPYILSGTVIRENLQLCPGIFTAKLRFPAGLVVPRFGVYACRAIVDGMAFAAVTHIGTRPPADGEGITVEPWLPDCSRSLLGREITLEFHRFLRPERDFGNPETLRAELLKNAEETRQLIQISFT